MIANCKVTALVYFTKRNSQATDQPKSHKVDTEHKLQIYAMEMHSYKATLSWVTHQGWHTTHNYTPVFQNVWSVWKHLHTICWVCNITLTYMWYFEFDNLYQKKKHPLVSTLLDTQKYQLKVITFQQHSPPTLTLSLCQHDCTNWFTQHSH